MEAAQAAGGGCVQTWVVQVSSAGCSPREKAFWVTLGLAPLSKPQFPNLQSQGGNYACVTGQCGDPRRHRMEGKHMARCPAHRKRSVNAGQEGRTQGPCLC